MGFTIFGHRVFDLSAPFSYFEAFSTIVFVLFVSFCIFLYLSRLSNKHK